MSLRPDQRAQFVEWLQERSMSVCMNVGGYPDVIDGDTIPGYLVIAGLDPGKDRYAPDLTILRWHDAEQWYRRAVRYARQEWGRDPADWDMTEALYETE